MQLLETSKTILNLLLALQKTAESGYTLTVLKSGLSDIDAKAKDLLDGVQVELPLDISKPSPEFLAYDSCRLAVTVNKKRKLSDWLEGLQAGINELQHYINLQSENNQAASEVIGPISSEVSGDIQPLLLEEFNKQVEVDFLNFSERYLNKPEVTSPITRLLEIEQEIPQLLSAASNAYLQVGDLLSEAREEFDNQVQFLDWALAKFNIRKSQAFRLMKIAKEFGSDTRFAGVAMRVLDALSGESDEVKEKAAALAAAGQLNTPALQVIQGGKPEPLPEVQADPKPLNVAPIKADKPAPLEAAEASEEIKTLRLTIQNLVAQQDKLLQQLAELQRPRTQQLPMLPHFKSSSLHTRLGLATTASAKEVRAAYRAITAHYTPETNKEAFELLTAARDALLQEVAA